MKKVGIGMKCMFLLICCTVCLMKFGISEVKAETYGDYEYFVHEDDTVSIEKYKGKDAVIKIPLQIDGMAVTQLSEWAFSNCSNLTSVTIPSSIQNISDYAFDGCNNLASIIVDSKNSKYDSRNNCNAIIETSNNKLIYGCKNSIIPNDITSIGAFSFKDCISLTDITIPDGVTSIGYGAFSGCKGLTNITIPKSVSSIGYDDTDEDCTQSYNVFDGCTGLTNIIVSSENPRYDSRDNCNAIIETSSNELVSGCSNTIIPNSITSIGDSAFDGCIELKNITIPDSVTNIGEYAFRDCNGLSKITIPNKVTWIGEDAFNGCDGVTCIIVDSENPKYDSRDNCNAIIETSKNELVFGCSNTVIPNSVTSIDGHAFSNCKNLTSIKIPSSVEDIPSGLFFGCTGLTSIVVDSGNPKYDSRDNCNAIIEKNSGKLISGCSKSFIPNSVTVIENWAFSGCKKLDSVVIPQSVKTIGDYAFYACDELKEITIPDSVTWIGDFAFFGCIGLKNIIIPDSVKCIGNSSFYGCVGLNEVTIPNSITSIDDCAFYGCVGLTEITIPNSVTSIGDYTFNGCTELKSIIIPSSVKSIGDEVFDDCSSDMVIYTESGSAAEQYAKRNGCAVKPLDNGTQNPPNQDNNTKPSDNTNKPSSGGDSKPDDAEKPSSGGDSKPGDTEKPSSGGDSKPGDAEKPSSGNDSKPAATPEAKGTKLPIPNAKYEVKVTSSDAKNPTVAYVKTTDSKATTINVPDTVTYNSITYKVTIIADKAFYNKKKVKKVIIGKNVTSIGKNAFKNCTQLKTVEIKSTIFNKIGSYAFSGCKNLTKITLKSTKLTKSSVGKNALNGTNKKLVIKVPKSKVKNYQKYFKNKGNKTVKVKK